jgi:class 3 adenylate cyclase
MMYFVLLCIGVHHREMIQRKVLNYERILNVETKKTNDLISNLIPYHLLNVIINEKRQVDCFENMTLLYVDIPGFVNFHKDVVRLLSRLFTRFDQLTIENKVYKVQTIGDCYIVMGYSGRVEQSARTQAI